MADERMYMVNHNLNTQINLVGTELLVPTTALKNETNAVNGTGSLGLMANNCAGVTISDILKRVYQSLLKLPGHALPTSS